MRSLIIALLAGTACNAFAVTVKITDRRGRVMHTRALTQNNLPRSVGAITVEMLDAAGINYVGGDSGLAQIGDLGQDWEEIDNYRGKAWGWCYSLDGTVPDLMPDKIFVESDASTIHWFYGYAYYDRGDWTKMCATD